MVPQLIQASRDASGVATVVAQARPVLERLGLQSVLAKLSRRLDRPGEIPAGLVKVSLSLGDSSEVNQDARFSTLIMERPVYALSPAQIIIRLLGIIQLQADSAKGRRCLRFRMLKASLCEDMAPNDKA